MKKTIRNIILGFNVITVLALLLSYLSIYCPPDKWWIPSLFGLAYPLILVVNIIFLIYWLFIYPRYALLSLIFILAGCGFIFRHIQFKGRSIEKGDLKIVSYNVQYFYGDGNSDQHSNAEKIINFLNERKADIICLQEVRLRTNTIFNLNNTVERLIGINHYQYARSSTTYGSVTMTRFPIIKMGEIRFKNSRNITIYSDVLIQGDTVRIFNVHLQSYHIDPNNYSVMDLSEINQEEDLREMKEISLKFKNAIELRAEQVREIRNYIDDSPYPVIVCGDFNDTPASYSYHKIASHLKDAFVCSGKGIGKTYIGGLPSVRIDYILHSKSFKSYNFRTYDFRMSDHLPVSCELVIEK